MKNVFDMKYQSDRWDGDCFKVRELPAELKQAHDALASRGIELALNEMPRRYRTWRLVLLLACGFFAVLGLELLSAAKPLVGGILLVSAVAALAALIAVHLRGKSLRLSEEETKAEFDVLNRENEELDRRCREAMGVPLDAVEVDVPSRIYDTHLRGEGKVYANGLCPVFLENDSLCFFDGEDVFAIPLAAIDGVVRVQEAITLEDWVKETPHTETPYDAYGICETEEWCYRMASYCALRCHCGGESYQVVIPTYDIDPILRLTGLALEEE